MHTLPDHFDILLSIIEPPEDRSDMAKEMPDTVRNHLKQSESIITVEPYSKLAGSYARNTAVGDIKDVDIIVFLHSDYEDEKPASVLRKLRTALSDIPNSESIDLRSQRRSIHVHFTDCDFHLDVVPAIAPEGKDKPLLIPDRTQSEWKIKSHPFGYHKLLSKLNGNNQSKVIPLIKLLKYWRDIQMTYRRPKSYWLECLIVHQIGKSIKTKGKAYAELFADALDGIYKKFSHTLNCTNGVPKIADPILGHDVAFNWEREHFEAFMKRVDTSRKWARQALDEDDCDKRIETWRRIFGKEFPDAAEVEARSMAAAIQSGSLFVTSRGRVLTEPSTGSIEVPRHRNYGDD